MNAGEIIIDHALALDWARLPAGAQQAARTFLHDTICVGVAGRNAANTDRVFAAAQLWVGADGSPVLGRPGARLAAPYAAFVNAFQIHAQEFDCVHEAAVAHPMATVVAALMAETARSGPHDGANFLSALVAGVDVVATLGVAVTSPLKFFRPATAGIFGSVAALARLRRMDRAMALNAFGCALAFASGTMQAHVEGKPTLALQVAAAARSLRANRRAPHRSAVGLPGIVRIPRRGNPLPEGWETLPRRPHGLGRGRNPLSMAPEPMSPRQRGVAHECGATMVGGRCRAFAGASRAR